MRGYKLTLTLTLTLILIMILILILITIGSLVKPVATAPCLTCFE